MLLCVFFLTGWQLLELLREYGGAVGQSVAVTIAIPRGVANDEPVSLPEPKTDDRPDCLAFVVTVTFTEHVSVDVAKREPERAAERESFAVAVVFTDHPNERADNRDVSHGGADNGAQQLPDGLAVRESYDKPERETEHKPFGKSERDAQYQSIELAHVFAKPVPFAKPKHQSKHQDAERKPERVSLVVAFRGSSVLGAHALRRQRLRRRHKLLPKRQRRLPELLRQHRVAVAFAERGAVHKPQHWTDGESDAFAKQRADDEPERVPHGGNEGTDSGGNSNREADDISAK